MLELQKHVATLVSTLKHVRGSLPDHRCDRGHEFEQVVDPIFINLQPVVDDYVALFSSTLAALNEARSGPSIKGSVQALRRNRGPLLRVRSVVPTLLADLTERSHDRGVKRFLRSVERVLCSVDLDRSVANGSSSATAKRLLESPDEGGVDSHYAAIWIRACLSSIETSFAATAQVHAHLRVKHIIRLAKKPE